MSNTAAQQRRRRARKRRGITLPTNTPKLKLKPLSGWHYGAQKPKRSSRRNVAI